MGLLYECEFCHQFFSKSRSEDHMRTAHFKQWARAQKKPASPTSPSLKVHQLSPYSTMGVPLRPIGTTKQTGQKQRRDVSRKKSMAVNVERPGPSSRRAPEPGPMRPALHRALEASEKKIGKTKLTPPAAVVKTPSKTRKESRLTNSYGLQLQRVPERNNPRLFDGAATRQSPTYSTRPPGPLPSNPSGRATTPCSCGGENELCYRCFGTGYYEVSAKQAARLEQQPKVRAATGSGCIASFASDPRGGSHSLRELGRFASTPDHDDYGDESSS